MPAPVAPRWGRAVPNRLAALVLAAAVPACTTLSRAPVVPAPAPASDVAGPVAEPVQPRGAEADPVLQLIAISNEYVARAQEKLRDGHLESARAEFNRALEALMSSPYGGRTEPRLREHFDRLVERISALEILALAQADGFSEPDRDSTSVDDLLTVATFEPPPATEATAQAVAADPTDHDIEIPLNERVLAFVELFTGRLKAFLEEGLARGLRYLPMIQEAFRAEGLPLDLAYVPLVESAFKPTAVSRASARGIWQFMRATGLENGLRYDWYVDERADPDKATRAAAKYLKTLHDMFGDWHLALASYNGGPGRVQRAMKASGRSDFWSLTARSRLLPRETRDYVPLVLASIVVAKNPLQYGLEVRPLRAPATERVTLPTPVDLRRIAEWIDTPVQVIQELNPELRRWTTPLGASDYELRVPAGTADFIRAHLAEAAPEELAPFNRYTVKRGDTITTVARALKVSRSDLAQANYLSLNARLQVGQQLIVPSAPSILLARATSDRSSDVEARARAVVPAAAADPVAAAPVRVVYQVRRGDTLTSIARLYRTTVASLRQWNSLSSSAIRAGQRLVIFTRQAAVATN